MKRTQLLVFLLLGVTGHALAEIPNVRPLASCVRSHSIMMCNDSRGGYYSIAKHGTTLSSSGFDGATRQHWSQTTTQFGRLFFFTGVTRQGLVWVGSNRKLGWNVSTRMATSEGDRLRLVCNRLNGCQ